MLRFTKKNKFISKWTHNFVKTTGKYGRTVGMCIQTVSWKSINCSNKQIPVSSAI